MQQFHFFCSQTGITPTFPINEDILIKFSVFMAQSVQHSTIKNYLSAIKHFHSDRRYALNLLVFLLLQLILYGILRFQGVNSQARRPVTLYIINLFYHLNVNFTTNKDSLQITFRMN